MPSSTGSEDLSWCGASKKRQQSLELLPVLLFTWIATVLKLTIQEPGDVVTVPGLQHVHLLRRGERYVVHLHEAMFPVVLLDHVWHRLEASRDEGFQSLISRGSQEEHVVGRLHGTHEVARSHQVQLGMADVCKMGQKASPSRLHPQTPI